MAKAPQPLPNMDNLTPIGLVDLIKEQRDIQKEAKRLEGIYRQRLDSTRDLNASAIETDTNIATFSVGAQERLDTDAIRSAFSRDQLLEKGWLKVIETTTLKIDAKPPKT